MNDFEIIVIDVLAFIVAGILNYFAFEQLKLHIIHYDTGYDRKNYDFIMVWVFLFIYIMSTFISVICLMGAITLILKNCGII
jgi:hypothetical protein